MLDVLIGVFILLVGFLGGAFVVGSRIPKEAPKIEVSLPEIQVPEIKVVIEAPMQASANDELIKRAIEYEDKMEKERRMQDKAQKMTDEFLDVNVAAQSHLDAYLDGTVNKG